MRLLSEPLIRNSVRIGQTQDDGTLVLEGKLRETEGADSWLKPLIENLHRRAVEKDIPVVVIDIRRVEYANAAAWKCFVYWLRLAREDPAARYSVRILSSSDQRWQQLGMPALRAFGGQHLEVQVFRGEERVA